MDNETPGNIRKTVTIAFFSMVIVGVTFFFDGSIVKAEELVQDVQEVKIEETEKLVEQEEITQTVQVDDKNNLTEVQENINENEPKKKEKKAVEKQDDEDIEMGISARQDAEKEEREAILDKANENMKNLCTPENIWIVERIMMFEGGLKWLNYYDKEPEKVEYGCKLIGSCPINRLRGHYGDAQSMMDVLMAPRQYGTKYKVLSYDDEVPALLHKWTVELFSEGTVGPKNLVYQNTEPGGKFYDKVYNTYFGTDSKIDN